MENNKSRDPQHAVDMILWRFGVMVALLGVLMVVSGLQLYPWKHHLGNFWSRGPLDVLNLLPIVLFGVIAWVAICGWQEGIFKIKTRINLKPVMRQCLLPFLILGLYAFIPTDSEVGSMIGGIVLAASGFWIMRTKLPPLGGTPSSQ